MHKKDSSFEEKEIPAKEVITETKTQTSDTTSSSDAPQDSSIPEDTVTDNTKQTGSMESSEPIEQSKKDSFISRCHGACRSLHPAWWLVILLVILLAITIGCYERKIHRTNDHYGNFISMMHESNDRPSYYRHSNRMSMWPVDQDFNEMMQDIQRIQKSHQVMMDQIFDRPTVIVRQDSKPTSDTNYSGYREVNGDFIRYNIQSQGNSIKGTITGSNKDTLSSIKTSIEKTGAKGELKDNTLQFTGSNTILNPILKTLGN